MKYKFWSIYNGNGWVKIPPNEKYIPDWYPENALVKKHEQEEKPSNYYYHKGGKTYTYLKKEYEDIILKR